jgi:hypothetical protein
VRDNRTSDSFANAIDVFENAIDNHLRVTRHVATGGGAQNAPAIYSNMVGGDVHVNDNTGLEPGHDHHRRVRQRHHEEFRLPQQHPTSDGRQDRHRQYLARP